jgi:hypothetical protein
MSTSLLVSGNPSVVIKAGLYDIPPAESDPPRLHQSIAAELMNRSPLHAWHKAFRREPEEFDAARSLGTVCHALLLGKGEDNLVPVDAPDFRTGRAREERDAALAIGKTPVLVWRYEEARRLAAMVVLALAARGITLSGRSEVTAIWRKHGVWCQGRMDHVILPKLRTRNKHAVILDFKFTGGAAVKKTCEARFIEHGYDIQDATYTEALGTIFPKLRGRIEMIFVFIETDPPHAIRLMPVAGSMKTSGIWRWEKARQIWKGCLEVYGTDKPWPSYGDDNEPAECPQWALNAQITEEMVEAGGNL